MQEELLSREDFLRFLNRTLRKLPKENFYKENSLLDVKMEFIRNVQKADYEKISHYILLNEVDIKIDEIPEELRLYALVPYFAKLGYDVSSFFDIYDRETRNYLRRVRNILQLSSFGSVSLRGPLYVVEKLKSLDLEEESSKKNYETSTDVS